MIQVRYLPRYLPSIDETFEMGMNKDEHTDRGLSSEKLSTYLGK